MKWSIGKSLGRAEGGALEVGEDKRVPAYVIEFTEGLKEAGVSVVTALPESLLKSVYGHLAADPDIRYIPVSNEADMPGIAAGCYLGGKKAVILMENSGLRQLCEPLARLMQTHQLPLVMVMSFRGDLGEYNYWGHSHAQAMQPLLDALRIPYRIVRRVDEIRPMLRKAWVHADSSQWPVALVFTDECVETPVYAAV
jgi:sulfopyruvate decarboxylase subunit alpha